MTSSTARSSMTKVDALIPVQQLDAEIHRLRVQVQRRPKELAASEQKLTRVQEVLEAMRAEIKALKLDAAKRETSVKEFDDKINKLLVQMNMAKKNDEYQAFQKEISGFKADKQRVEDGLLDFMYQLEEKGKLEKVREGEVKVAEGEFAEAKKRVDAEVAELNRQLGGVESRRKEAGSGTEKESLSLYERRLKAKDDGVALAPIMRYSAVEDKGVVKYWGCGGCSMGVTSQDANELKRGKELVKCRSCSRLLYWTEEVQEAPKP